MTASASLVGFVVGFFFSFHLINSLYPMSFLAFAVPILSPIPLGRRERASGCGGTSLLAWVNPPQRIKSSGFTFFPFPFAVVLLLSISNSLFCITVFRQSQFLKRTPTAS